jgi:SAM-dependent methyltransferase
MQSEEYGPGDGYRGTGLRAMIKAAAKALIPGWILDARRRHVAHRMDGAMAGKSPREVFTDIYENGRWGRGPDGGYSSGGGSHIPTVVDPYVEAVSDFLRQLGRPDVADLGCGDFSVGRRLRPACGHYLACDVVPSLIERNRGLFVGIDVDFRCLDIVADPLPPARIAFVRQVFQHLRNDQIAAVLPKLAAYDYLILTEHLPEGAFTPNRDKAAGPGIRFYDGSGIVLDAPPFNLRALEKRSLCTVQTEEGIIQTDLYRLS